MSPTSITFYVPGIPISQPRQRHRVVCAAGRTFATNYTPAKAPVNAWKAAVALAASQQYTGPLLDYPVAVVVEFVFPRPKRLCWKTRAMPREKHASKPDTENCIKALLDALTGVVLKDDALVWSLEARKFYCAGDEPPGTQVAISGEGA